jgi:hypothetical protein
LAEDSACEAAAATETTEIPAIITAAVEAVARTADTEAVAAGFTAVAAAVA